MAAMNRILQIIVALLLLGVGFYFVQLLQDTGGRMEPVANLLGDTDGDGIMDIRDPCPCTADNVRRQYRGAEYCVAEQPADAFNEMIQYFTEGDGEEEFGDNFAKNFHTEVEGRTGRSQVLYTADVCQQALLRGQWPARPELVNNNDN